MTRAPTNCLLMTQKKQPHISTLGSRATSVVSITLAMLTLALLGLVLLAGHNAMEGVRSNLIIVLKVAPGTAEYDTAPLKQTLNKAPFSAGYTYRSAKQVLDEETARMGQDVMALLDENPYSAEFEIKVNPQWANPDSLTALTQRLGSLPGVDEVITDQSVAAQVDNSLERLALILVCIAAALTAIAVVMINNTVSLSIYSRRFIIHTMKLVGASRGYIRRPFATAGMATGALAGFITAAITTGIWAWVQNTMPDIAPFLPLWQCLVLCAAISLLSTLMATVTATMAANRYLNKNYDQLFRK